MIVRSLHTLIIQNVSKLIVGIIKNYEILPNTFQKIQ